MNLTRKIYGSSSIARWCYEFEWLRLNFAFHFIRENSVNISKSIAPVHEIVFVISRIYMAFDRLYTDLFPLNAPTVRSRL